MIPKIVHFVWVGPNPIPPEDSAYIAEWRALMPDWRFMLWNNTNIDFTGRYLRQAFAARAWNRVSDYVRMDALANFGGVYLDTDVQLLKPLDSLRVHEAFLGFQLQEDAHPDLVNGAVFGSTIGHWLPVQIRDRFNAEFDGRIDTNSYSGPGILTDVLRSNGLNRYCDHPIDVAGVRIFPTRFFYPYHWDEPFAPSVIGDDTIAVHHWAKSWGAGTVSFKSKMKKKLTSLTARHAPRIALLLSRLSVSLSTRSGAN